MAERLVVVGGDAAGMSAASQARRRRGPDDLEIVAFERGGFTSYSACGIPYWIAGTVADRDDLIVRDPQTFRDRFSIDVRLRHEVTEIDLDRRAVRVRAGGTEAWEGFDQLVYATGASPVRPPIDGVDASGVFDVQTLDDGSAIIEAIQRRRPRRAVVVGGGYIGLEMAEALAVRGLETALVERTAQPMNTLDEDMGALVADAMHAQGITLHLSETVTGLDVAGGHVRAVVTEHRTLPADMVVLGLGSQPNVDLARAAGIEVGESGGVTTDARMHTRAEGVWAAGDCVEVFHRVARRPVTVALGTHANKQGRAAGINIGGGYATFPGIVGTAVSKICEVEVARTGLQTSEADQAGFEHVSVAVDSTTRAGYFPGAGPIRTKIIAERRTGRLLGAQIVGREGAAKRIDVLAVALWNEMTVGEVCCLDLSYAPPFSPVWDPVLIAARKAAEAVEDAAAGRR